MKPAVALDLSPNAPWKQRSRAWGIAVIGIGDFDTSRGLVTSNRSGVFQLEAWNLDTGELRTLTDRPSGVAMGFLSPDERSVYYLDDVEPGSEIGHLVRIPYEGGEAEDLTPDLEPYTLTGVAPSLDRSTFAFIAATQAGSHLYVASLDGAGGLRELRMIHHKAKMMMGACLSASGDIVVVSTNERSATTDMNLVALDTATGSALGELFDERASIQGCVMSWAAGDARLITATDRSGALRPILWDPRTGERTDFELPGLDGDLAPVGWSPDQRSVLLLQVFKAETSLHRLDLETGNVTAFPHPPGNVSRAFFDANGDVIVGLQHSAEKLHYFKLPPGGAVEAPVLLTGGEAPESRRFARSRSNLRTGQRSRGGSGYRTAMAPFQRSWTRMAARPASKSICSFPARRRSSTTASPS